MATVDTGDYGAVQQEDTRYGGGNVGDLNGLITALAGGITNVPGGTAVDQINFWREKLEASDDTIAASIGVDLSALRDALSVSDTDVPTLGDILLSLGAGVGNLATGNQDADLGDKLRHLSTLLTEAGQSLVSEDSGIDGVTEGDGTSGAGANYGAGGDLTSNPTLYQSSANPADDSSGFANQ